MTCYLVSNLALIGVTSTKHFAMFYTSWARPFKGIQTLDPGYIGNMEVPAGYDYSVESFFPPFILASDVAIFTQDKSPLIADLLRQFNTGVV